MYSFFKSRGCWYYFDQS
ncbi:hypothetical protein [Francisella noatunensis]